MSSWRDNHKRANSEESASVNPDCVMFDHNRNLHECLAGYEYTPGNMQPGCKLSIWIEGCFVKFCINDGSVGKVGFGTLDTDLKLSAALEEVITSGKIEWKDSTPRVRRG